MKRLRLLHVAAFALLSCATAASAQTQTLFNNVRIFDGRSGTLSAPSHVLIKGNTIERISTAPIAADSATTVIAGGGRTLMPGLIDAHWHTMLVRLTAHEAVTGDVGYMNVLAVLEANDTLMRGFTTVRDLGGPAFGLKQAIDQGLVAGPRIYPSGAIITITGGHGDFRQLSEIPRTPGAPLSRMEEMGGSMVADSPDMTAGGGVASPHSPIDVSTFTEAELRAAVEAAENWGTYVTVHAYTPAAIQRAIAAGVRCIDHGHLMDEATAKMLADKGIWLSIQPFLDDPDGGVFPPGSVQHYKKMQVVAGTERAYALAKKYGVKTAFGTDILFSKDAATRQAAQLVKLTRWYSAPEILKMATSTNAELLALSGLRSPYPGKLGVVEEGALADLILVDGNPLENIQLIADPAKSFFVIMKDGKVVKNLVPR
jgi:imidazolonepropionase-like amidohydrolase